MALLLNIDTAVQSASICLTNGEKVFAELKNPSGREAASWLHVAIPQLLQDNHTSLQQLNAVAVCAGPGSYTGLRVGMAAAKGLCYALNIPLITLNTLQVMAASAGSVAVDLLCPLIDARRMEVFTALYNQSLEEVMPSTSLILDNGSFRSWLAKNTICFLGNGSEKARAVIRHEHAAFLSIETSAANMARLSATKFDAAQFSDLAYTEPFYGKEFHSSVSKKNY